MAGREKPGCNFIQCSLNADEGLRFNSFTCGAPPLPHGPFPFLPPPPARPPASGSSAWGLAVIWGHTEEKGPDPLHLGSLGGYSLEGAGKEGGTRAMGVGFNPWTSRLNDLDLSYCPVPTDCRHLTQFWLMRHFPHNLCLSYILTSFSAPCMGGFLFLPFLFP